MAKQNRIEIGNYTACHCRSLTTGAVWFRVFRNGVHDPLSDHPSIASAKLAIKRYIAADARRAA